MTNDPTRDLAGQPCLGLDGGHRASGTPDRPIIREVRGRPEFSFIAIQELVGFPCLKRTLSDDPRQRHIGALALYASGLFDPATPSLILIRRPPPTLPMILIRRSAADGHVEHLRDHLHTLPKDRLKRMNDTWNKFLGDLYRVGVGRTKGTREGDPPIQAMKADIRRLRSPTFGVRKIARYFNKKYPPTAYSRERQWSHSWVKRLCDEIKQEDELGVTKNSGAVNAPGQ